MPEFNCTGPMPKGGTFQGFTTLLARLYRTFEPLKDAIGADAKDFVTLTSCLSTLATLHQVFGPELTLSAHPGLRGFATPNEVFSQLLSLSSTYFLRTEENTLLRARIGKICLDIFKRHHAAETAKLADLFRARSSQGGEA